MSDNEETKQNLSKKNRSAAYPAVDLPTAIKLTTKLRERLSLGPYNRLTAVQALDYKGISGASAPVIAALARFGLLTKQGNTYRQSDLANRIIKPLSNVDKTRAIVEAVQTPKLYLAIIQKYTNSSLPTMLENILFHEYRINENVAKNVAENIRKSLEFAGLLVNGVITDNEQQSEVTTNLSESRLVEGDVSKLSDIDSVRNRASKGEIFIEMPSGIKIVFPSSMGVALASGRFAESISKLEGVVKELSE
mgnify:CR=1 FL=1